MLTIRLQRTGKKNQADFRIVLAEKQAPVNKKFTEVLGSYNPRKKNFQVKEERVKYWLGQQVQLSPTVHNLFVTKSLLDAKKVKAFNTPKKPVETPTTPAASAATPPSEGGETAAETPAEAAPTSAEGGVGVPTASVGIAAEVIVEEKMGEKTAEVATAEVKAEEAVAEVKAAEAAPTSEAPASEEKPV